MDFTHPHFAEPEWLWGAVLFPLVILGLHMYASWRRAQQLHQFAAARPMMELAASCHQGRRRFKTGLLAISALVAGLALARPQWGEQSELVQTLGEDVLFALDISRSMLAPDVKPNRLTRAKMAIADFARQHARGRVGLLVFSGSAFLQCPLTGDHDAFQESVMAADEKAVPVAGTDLGRGLEEAMECLEKDNRRKVIVVVTDGEDLAAGAVAKAAQVVTNRAVQATFYMIGVGTAAGSTIPIFNEQGQPDVIKDPQGQAVVTRLDAKNLEAVAQACHGYYYPLGALGEGLTRVRADLRATATRTDAANQRKLGVDRFHFFVAFLLLLLVVESLMGDRRAWPVSPQPASGTAAPVGAKTALLLFMIGLGLAAAQAAETARPDEAARTRTLMDTHNSNVIAEIQSIADTNLSLTGKPVNIPAPRNARQAYNAGVAKLSQKKWAEAETLLQSAASSQQKAVQPEAIYNLGQVRFQQGAEALKEAMSPENASRRMSVASTDAVGATLSADLALSGTSVDGIIAAYREGQGAQKQLKATIEAVKQALETYSATLIRWERASSDFKTVTELNPKDSDGAFNGQVVDRHIARLVDDITKMLGMAPMLGTQRQELRMRMKALKERLPPGFSPGEDEDEEEEDQPKKPQAGQKEAPNKEGKQRMLSREEAMRWLEQLRLDSERKLPMRGTEEGKDSAPGGRNW